MAKRQVTRTCYGEDLAKVHDSHFTAFVRGACPVILELMRDAGFIDGLVVDLGCGSGVFSDAAIEAGFDAFGVDVSDAMIAMCRERVPAGRFECASFLDVEIPPCVAVVSIGEVFNYLHDETVGEQTLDVLFRRVHRALEPGGVFVFDVAEPGRCPEGSRAVRWATEGWVMLSETREDGPSLVREISVFALQEGGLYRRSDETHRLRLYERQRLQESLSNAGFDCRTMDGYQGAEIPWGYCVHVAHKREA